MEGCRAYRISSLFDVYRINLLTSCILLSWGAAMPCRTVLLRFAAMSIRLRDPRRGMLTTRVLFTKQQSFFLAGGATAF